MSEGKGPLRCGIWLSGGNLAEGGAFPVGGGSSFAREGHLDEIEEGPDCHWAEALEFELYSREVG